MGVLGLVFWLQDRSRKVIFWMTVWALGVVASALGGSEHIALPGIFAIGLQQPLYALTDFAVWFLLLYLLELENNPRLRRLVSLCAWTELCFQTLDAFDIQFLWTSSHVLAAQVIDFLTTLPVVLLGVIPLVLIVAALGKRLSVARWLVAAVGASLQLVIAIRNSSGQGQRFTHWTLSQKLQPLQNVLSLLLVFAIIYAVVRFSAEQRAQRNALEQEYKSARNFSAS